MTPDKVFKFCPKCANPIKPNSIGVIKCNKCDFLYYINTAGAVAALIVNEDKQLLLVKRAKDPSKGMLDLPGGFIDIGESAEKALERELFEELNIKIKEHKIISTNPNSYTYKGITYSTIDIAFLCHIKNNEALNAADDVESYTWHNKDDINLEEIAFTSIRNFVKNWMQK